MPVIKYNDVSYGGGGGAISVKTTYVGRTTSISEGVINVSCDEDFTPTDGTILSVAFANFLSTLDTHFYISVNGGDEVMVTGFLSNTTLASGTLIFVYYHNINNVPMWMSLSTLFPISSVGGYGITSLTDSLTSDSVTSALTAKQGKALNDSKVDKVSGKGLSTNDYTTSEKNKLSGIASGAEVNVQADWNEDDSSSDAFIKNKPNIPPSATVDISMSDSSGNAVQNKVIKAYVDNGLSNKVDNSSSAISTLLDNLSNTISITNLTKFAVKPITATEWKSISLSTLEGYINNTHYTETEVDNMLADKADKSDLKPTTISLSNGGIYYHATRAGGTGMEIKIPLAYAPTNVTGTGLKYYDNNTWNDTTISGHIYTGAELIITFSNIPSASGLYGMQGTINLTYGSALSMGNPNSNEGITE